MRSTVTAFDPSIDLIRYDLAKGLDAELAEGKRLGTVDIVTQRLAVFGFELIRQIPQQLFVAAQDLSSAADRGDVGDRRLSSRRRLLIEPLPFPRQQLR